ncbi:MAG: protein-export membrane protein SecD [Clostridiales bacterium GWF2_38_85]|nr:MAG: protein-export membrane protein SecD [Clostridiales bacterium GWF2_38_85]
MTVSLRQIFLSRLSFWLILTVAGGFFLYNLKDYIKFGIDLKGGTYITLQIKFREAYKTEVGERVQDAVASLKEAKMVGPKNTFVRERGEGDVELPVPYGVMVFENISDANAAMDFLSRDAKGAKVDRTDTSVTIHLTPETLRHIDHDALESNINSLNVRINKFGVGETLIASHGTDRIIIELPNVHDPREVKEIIGRSATLEIKKVEESAHSEKDLIEKFGGSIPEGMMIIPGERGEFTEYYLVPSYTDLTGKLLKTASAGLGGKSGAESAVIFEFKPAGATKFAKLTSENVGNRLAVIIDGRAECAPVVNEPLSRGGSITGSFTPEQAQRLATLLKSGAFVAPVSVEEERQVGPSLGSAAIRNGFFACALGLLLLFLFSIITYKTAGLLAFIVLLYNLLFSLVLLAGLKATLTLPGIAGMILTIGAAIDASILIFERIREELANGIPLRKAIDAGFSGALSVIIDSNVTSLIVAIVLFQFGSGPIKGFAATQIVGIIATLITGLWMLRSMFTYLTDILGVTKMRI